MECFTTGVSGASHILHRNIDWRLFGKLVIPGVIGGILGAYVLTTIDAGVARPIVLAYLTAIGLHLVWRGYHYPPPEKDPRIVAPLGLAGGFLDAAGGGGWGPVVTSNLLLQGASPRKVIGTVNTAEFFLTVTISATFVAALGWAAFTTASSNVVEMTPKAMPSAPSTSWATNPTPMNGNKSAILAAERPGMGAPPTRNGARPPRTPGRPRAAAISPAAAFR